MGFRAKIGELVKGTGEPAQLVIEPVDRFSFLDLKSVKECKKPSFSSSSFAFPVEGETSPNQGVGLPGRVSVEA